MSAKARYLGALLESPWSAYTTAIALVAVAFSSQSLLAEWIGDRIPFAMFFVAVAVSAWVAGPGPCLLALGLSAAVLWFFVLPTGDGDSALHFIGFVAFLTTGFVMVVFGARTRMALSKTAEARRLSEQQAAEAMRAREDIQRYATALQESERRFRGYAEHTQDVLWITRGDRPQLIYVNPSFSRVYGRPPTEILADFSRLADYVHEDERARAQTFWRRCGEGPIVEEYRIVRPDGSMARIRRRGFPIPDEQGAILYRAAISEDVTEEKRIQDERDRLLESERVARQDAERTSRIKDEFLATLSHELRTPLNAVLGWVQVLRSTELSSDEARRALDAIARNGRAQAKLIDDLLDMSGIMSGKLKLEVELVNLAQTIHTTVDSMAAAAHAKEIRISQRVDPAVGPVRGDPNRLQQLIWNLVSNAVKFTPPRGRVDVHLEKVDAHCEIRVSDTGRGIPADFLPYVFDRFSHRDRSTVRTEGGLGLGLAIVKQLAEHHGGSVAVHSQGENCGATFVVSLPVATRTASDRPDAVHEPKLGTGPVARGHARPRRR